MYAADYLDDTNPRKVTTRRRVWNDDELHFLAMHGDPPYKTVLDLGKKVHVLSPCAFVVNSRRQARGSSFDRARPS